MAFSPELSVVIFGLLASMSYGSGDFLGGMASKRMSSVAVVVIAHFIGLFLLLALALLSREALPASTDLVWGALAGLGGALGLAGFYRALAVGRMGLNAPVVAVLATAFPIIVAVTTQGVPQPHHLLGFVFGIIALALVSYSGGTLNETRGLGLAVAAAFGFGAFFICISRVESEGVFWPLLAARPTPFPATLIIARFTRQNVQPTDSGLFRMAAFAGALDVFGNIFFVLAEQSGRLDIAAVLSSLYPAMTVLLARLILNERLSRIQMLGVLTALAAIILISLPAPANA